MITERRGLLLPPELSQLLLSSLQWSDGAAEVIQQLAQISCETKRVALIFGAAVANLDQWL